MERFKSVFLLLILLLMVPLVGFAQEDDRGQASVVYDFPRDHRFHGDDPQMNENFLEWVYFTGIMNDDNGDLWGYQVTIFYGSPVDYLGRNAFFYDVALSDVATESFYHYRGGWVESDQITELEDGWQWSNGTLTVRYSDTFDDWLMSFSGEMEDLTTGERALVDFDFTAVNDKSNYYRQNPDGVSKIGICEHDLDTFNGYTYYYTHPELTTQGTLEISGTSEENNVYSLTGDTWFDHQWGNFVHCVLKWDWFSLRLDDGSFIMIFAELDENNQYTNLLGLTYLNPEGDMTYYYNAEELTFTPLRTWTHPQSGVEYPIEWDVTTPVGDFGIVPYFDFQGAGDFPGIPNYWEGLISVHRDTVDGEQIGIGYLEVAR